MTLLTALEWLAFGLGAATVYMLRAFEDARCGSRRRDGVTKVPGARHMSEQVEAIYQAVGARVRMIRETLGLTQDELAARMDGMTQTSIVNFEQARQRLPLHKIEKIAEALGTNPKNLLKGIWW